MPLAEISLRSKIRNYKVVFAETETFLDELHKLPNVLFAVDENVWRHHRQGALSALDENQVMIIEISEERKSLVGAEGIYDWIIERASKKNTTLVSIGGGILQDITGFAASTLYRGINWNYVPTTMLAQCDSCIGAKTSLNYRGFKNLIGTFYPPSAVYIYAPFLMTQTEIDYFSGVGELIKLYLIGGKEHTARLLANMGAVAKRNAADLLPMIKSALLIKKEYIEEDEFDVGRRNMLNFGHCFGHALETATDFAIPHGQAVVFGIILANQVSVNRGLMSDDYQRYLGREVLEPVLKVELGRYNINEDDIIAAMKKDKKRTGEGLALVMMNDMHEMIRASDLTESEARRVLKALKGE